MLSHSFRKELREKFGGKNYYLLLKSKQCISFYSNEKIYNYFVDKNKMIEACERMSKLSVEFKIKENVIIREVGKKRIFQLINENKLKELNNRLSAYKTKFENIQYEDRHEFEVSREDEKIIEENKVDIHPYLVNNIADNLEIEIDGKKVKLLNIRKQKVKKYQNYSDYSSQILNKESKKNPTQLVLFCTKENAIICDKIEVIDYSACYFKDGN